MFVFSAVSVSLLSNSVTCDCSKVIRHFGYQLTRASDAASLMDMLGEDRDLLQYASLYHRMARHCSSASEKMQKAKVTPKKDPGVMAHKPGKPLASKDVVLSRSVIALVDSIAQNSHAVWAKNKIAQGFVYGNDVNSLDIKQSPLLVPYENLPAKERVANRRQARQMLKAVFSLDFRIIPPKKTKTEMISISSTPVLPKTMSINQPSTVMRRTLRDLENLRHSLLRSSSVKKFDVKQLLNLFLVKLVKTSEDEDMISELIEAGANVDSHDEYRHTPLYIAAKRGKLSMVKILVEKKAAIEKGDRNGMTALSISAYLGNLEMCRLLVGFGSSLSSFDRQKFTPLHHAAKNGHSAVCKMLTNSIAFAIDRETRRLATAGSSYMRRPSSTSSDPERESLYVYDYFY